MAIYAQSSTLRNLTIPLVDVDQTTLQNEDLLQYNSTTGRFENRPLSSGGVSVITTASNVGAGSGVFKQKTSQDLEFKSITAGAGIVLTTNANDIEIASNLALTTGSNLGTGTNVFSSKVGDDLQFRSIKASADSINFTIAQSLDGNEVEISSVAEVNTASNLAGGEGIFAQKSTYDLEFKSIVGGTNVTVTSDANTVTISSSQAIDSNTSYSYNFGITFDGSGDVDTITNIPSGWTITNTGNIITVVHNAGKIVKMISYWGKDATNGWQYRMPTAGYQATLTPGSETSQFKIDINAPIAGADASSEAKVNVIL